MSVKELIEALQALPPDQQDLNVTACADAGTPYSTCTYDVITLVPVRYGAVDALVIELQLT